MMNWRMEVSCFFFFGGGRGDSLAGFLMLFFWGVGV